MELCKLFGVKRITAFAVRCHAFPDSLRIGLESELSPFNQVITEDKADLTKFRYADDSMFAMRTQNELRSTLIKKWTVEINPKNFKKQAKMKSNNESSCV